MGDWQEEGRSSSRALGNALIAFVSGLIGSALVVLVAMVIR